MSDAPTGDKTIVRATQLTSGSADSKIRDAQALAGRRCRWNLSIETWPKVPLRMQRKDQGPS